MVTRRTWTVAATVAGLGLAIPGSIGAATKSLKVGEAAPDFELMLIDKSKVRFADLRGQVIVLNYWATWCAPCRKELPLLDAFYRKLQDKGLRVYAVTTEDSLPLYRLKPLFEAMAVPSVCAVKGPYGQYAAVPYNIVIDRGGRVRYAQAGSFDIDQLNAVLIPLLNERPPVTAAE